MRCVSTGRWPAAPSAAMPHIAARTSPDLHRNGLRVHPRLRADRGLPHRDDIGGFDVTDAVTFAFVSQGFLVADRGVRHRRDRPARSAPATSSPTSTGPSTSSCIGWPRTRPGRVPPPDPRRAAGTRWRAGVRPADRHGSDRCSLASLVSVVLRGHGELRLRFLVNLTAFWLLDIRGPSQMVILTQLFFAGLVLPITFFPGWLETLARALPFAGMLQMPDRDPHRQARRLATWPMPGVAGGVGRRPLSRRQRVVRARPARWSIQGG